MGIEAYAWARAKKVKHSHGGSVLREIACQADDATGLVRLSISDLMQGVGVSRDTIVNHLAALQSAGHIAVNKRKHPLPNEYSLIGYTATVRTSSSQTSVPHPSDDRTTTVRPSDHYSQTSVLPPSDHLTTESSATDISPTPDPSQMSALELVEHHKMQVEAPQEEQDPSIVPELISIWNTHCGALPKVEQPSDYVVGALGRMVEGMGIEKAKKKLELATLELARFPHPSFSLDHALRNRKYETLAEKHAKRLREQRFKEAA